MFALAFAVATPASASYDPIGSGSTTLRLDGGFAKLLRKNGITLSGRESARVRGGVATLHTAGGKADPTIGKAEIDLAGELILSREKKRVALKEITLKTKPTPIFAKVGGGQLKLARASRVSLNREGFGNDLLATGLRLTAKLATRLDKRLDVDAFAPGQRLGTLSSATEPSTVAILPTGLATISLDPAILAELKALSVSVNPIFPAEHQGPIFTLPIALGGALAPDGTGGTLRTAGSIEVLRLGAGQLFCKEPWFDLGGSSASSELDLEPPPTYPGKLGRVPFIDIAVPQGAFSTDPRARTIAVNGATLTLQAATAAYFNGAFAEGRDEFHPGDLLGTLSFTARSQ